MLSTPIPHSSALSSSPAQTIGEAAHPSKLPRHLFLTGPLVQAVLAANRAYQAPKLTAQKWSRVVPFSRPVSARAERRGVYSEQAANLTQNEVETV